jgi:hypothetical protein
MNLTDQLSDIDIGQAKLLSLLSERPAHIVADVFVWNGCIIDRATAIVALLKANNHVPVNDGVKMRMHQNFYDKFKQLEETEDLVFNDYDKDPVANARIWFNLVCRVVKRKTDALPNEVIKQILIDLHRN